jgi:hypothetical protein
MHFKFSPVNRVRFLLAMIRSRFCCSFDTVSCCICNSVRLRFVDCATYSVKSWNQRARLPNFYNGSLVYMFWQGTCLGKWNFEVSLRLCQVTWT